MTTTTAQETVTITCARCSGTGVYTRFHGTCYGCAGIGTKTVSARWWKAQQTREANAASKAAASRKTALAWAAGMTVDEIVSDQIRKTEAGETGMAAHMAHDPRYVAEVREWAERIAAEVAA